MIMKMYEELDETEFLVDEDPLAIQDLDPFEKQVIWDGKQAMENGWKWLEGAIFEHHVQNVDIYEQAWKAF